MLQPHRVFSVEQAKSSGGDTTAQCCTYEIIQGKIKRISVISIPLKSHVISQCRNPSEEKVVLGCADGSIILYDEIKKATLMVRAALMPVSLAWHPKGTIFFAAGSRGDIQVYDLALTPLRIQLVSEDPDPHRILQLAKFFRGPPNVLQFHLGAVSRERFSGFELVKEYLKHRQVDEAVTLLSSMNWDTDGSTCYSCLSAIVNHLLRLPLNAEREGQLESTLGTFYAPKFPLSEVVIMDYRDPISRLARRFFHHLLRYSRFDKAFLLAVDIGARDLFMVGLVSSSLSIDIHYMALDKGETALAEVAKRKAEQIESESLDSFDDVDDGLLENGFHQPYLPSYNQPNIQELPLSRQHPWQQDEHQPHTHNISHHHGNRHITNGGDQRDRRRPPDFINNLELEADLIHDYTAALQLDDPPWISNGHVSDIQWQNDQGKGND
ncbi:hypothetical protein FSP39_004357 [Pinctada imbricata]|uniref:Uncharacterized protein n=1 Tax=Pinctada imbricata TaxID=66713 RepID=A0AA88XVD3_PINIB|nr:hypothetical protein FSP39_004357 [Pinctada imbricata]